MKIKATDFIMNEAIYGNKNAESISNIIVDNSTVSEGDILVCKNGIWEGMSVAQVLGDATLLKGDDGFTPLPEFRMENGIQYLKFQIGVDTSGNPVYSNEVELVSIPKSSIDINVLGVSAGSYNSGDVIPSGTNLEDILKNMLMKMTTPTYTSPTLSIGGSSPLTVEAGTIANITISSSFIQNDAGAVTSFKVYKNGVVVFTGPTISTYTDNNLVIGDTSVVYKVEVSYATGGIKKTNTGVDYPTGQITAGTITSGTVTYRGIRKGFYGTSVSADTTLSETDIRILTATPSSVSAGSSFTISIPVGARKVVFAYPATLQDVSSVKYVEGMNADIKSVFSLQTLNVSGSNSYSPIQYKVYTYVPVAAFTSALTYTITI